jgi:hypothetical protein
VRLEVFPGYYICFGLPRAESRRPHSPSDSSGIIYPGCKGLDADIQNMANVGKGRYDQGAPPRLSDYAKEAKAKIDENYTKTFDNQPIRDAELPVLPPSVTRAQFNAAIAELRDRIGVENVELNDKVCSGLLSLTLGSRWMMGGT